MEFCDTSKSIPERAANLVSKLTIAEKIRQLSTYSFAKKYTHRFTPPVERIGLPGYSYHTEGLHGLRDSYIGSLNATMYPQVTAMAATANATLIHEMAHVMGIEARAVHNVYMDYLFSGGRGGNCTPSIGKCTGNNTELGTRGGFLSIYGPTMNIIRDPRWGRAQESISEDPYLNSLYASSFVKGLQGDIAYTDDTTKGRTLLAAATCKHMAVYNLEEAHYGGQKWMRHRFQANVTVQELMETYLPAFRACVEEGNAQQIMCSYNSIAVHGGSHPYNSTPACLDGDIQNRLMRDTWGFQGNIVSDCDASSDAHFAHHWGPGVGDGGNASAATTVVAGLEGGCDMDCGSFYTDFANESVAQGLLKEETIDVALRRIFTMRLRLGEFDPDPTGHPNGRGGGVYNRLGADDADTPAHRDSALRAARESICLLNNSLNLLPLKTGRTKKPRIACVGVLANSTRLNGNPDATGGGSEMGGKNDYVPAFTISILEGLRMTFGQENVGYDRALQSFSDQNTSGFTQAEQLAKASDVTVVVVGLDGNGEGEGHDRANTTLVGAQSELVQAMMSAVGPEKLVVVLVNGGPLSVDWIKHNCPTVIEAFEGGQSGGQALAEVLSGKTAPSGVLPYTMYPEHYLSEVVHWDMSMRKPPGRSYRFYSQRPLWPFGYSGSYTTWELAWAKHLPATLSVSELEHGVELAVTLHNTGKVSSAKALLFFASAKLKAGDGVALGWTPPIKTLFAVKKVWVHAGSSSLVVVNSTNIRGTCAFCTVDEQGIAAVREGSYTITIGDGNDSAVTPMITRAIGGTDNTNADGVQFLA